MITYFNLPLRKTVSENCNQNATDYFDENAFGNDVRKMTAILRRAQWAEYITKGHPNRQNLEIPRYTCPISHKHHSQTEMCVFLYWMVYILHNRILNGVLCDVGQMHRGILGSWLLTSPVTICFPFLEKARHVMSFRKGLMMWDWCLFFVS